MLGTVCDVFHVLRAKNIIMPEKGVMIAHANEIESKRCVPESAGKKCMDLYLV